MSKTQAPSAKALRKVLTNASFDPRANGPMKVVTEVGMSNLSYLEGRAIEAIKDNDPRRAITLLALAVAIDETWDHHYAQTNSPTQS